MATANTHEKVRIAAMSDIHYGKKSQGVLQAVFAEIAQKADALVICGDLTDYGLEEEAEILAKDLGTVIKQLPVLAVLGNHDYESGRQDRVRDIMTEAGVVMMDGETCDVKGVGFAGVKGFGGGFGQHMTTPWGEEVMKLFVREAVEEALKLENALAKLMSNTCIAVLHYAPIRATVEGESPEIFPFTGCSRLEDPLDNFQVVAAFHGHAHMGTLEGRTRGGVPVYNVALPVLRRHRPDGPPYYLLEIDVDHEEVQAEPEKAGATPAKTNGRKAK